MPAQILPARALTVGTWLPDDGQTVAGSEYERFERLVHGTHSAQAISILIDAKGLQPRPVQDTSNYEGDVVFMAGANEGHARYGRFVLSVDASYLLQKNQDGSPRFAFYLVEVVDYKTKSASRILVAPANAKPPKDCTDYNPRVPGGPWFIDQNDVHYGLTTTMRVCEPHVHPESCFDELEHVVEFMITSPLPAHALQLELLHVRWCQDVCREGDRCPDTRWPYWKVQNWFWRTPEFYNAATARMQEMHT